LTFSINNSFYLFYLTVSHTFRARTSKRIFQGRALAYGIDRARNDPRSTRFALGRSYLFPQAEVEYPIDLPEVELERRHQPTPEPGMRPMIFQTDVR